MHAKMRHTPCEVSSARSYIPNTRTPPSRTRPLELAPPPLAPTCTHRDPSHRAGRPTTASDICSLIRPTPCSCYSRKLPSVDHIRHPQLLDFSEHLPDHLALLSSATHSCHSKPTTKTLPISHTSALAVIRPRLLPLPRLRSPKLLITPRLPLPHSSKTRQSSPLLLCHPKHSYLLGQPFFPRRRPVSLAPRCSHLVSHIPSSPTPPPMPSPAP